SVPYYTQGPALRWINRISAELVTTWDLLEKAFIRQYCSPFKTTKKLEIIYNFKQDMDETLYHAWERMLNSQELIPLMTPTQALKSVQIMAEHSHDWYDETTSRKKINDRSNNIDAIQESSKEAHLTKEYEVDINTLTLEQYLAWVQDDIRPGVVKPKIGNDVQFEINSNFMRELRRKLFKVTDDESVPYYTQGPALRWINRISAENKGICHVGWGHNNMGWSGEVDGTVQVGWGVQCRPMREEGCASWDRGHSTWGGRGKGKHYGIQQVRGSPYEAFEMLSYYCYNLEKKNERTITRIKTDDNGVFEMLFIAIDASGNKSGSCGHGCKQLDCANCIWYMQMGNRHAAIALEVEKEFPLSFHVVCCRHLMMNLGLKNKKEKVYSGKYARHIHEKTMQRT
nr:hypothetical protein [Tanacetum cinerariifolium]